MKKIYSIITGLLLAASIFAQAPQKMSYQAVIRNSSKALITTSPVGMKISILKGSATGTAAYVETQTASTNANGLVSVEIGTGTVVTGSFASIDWAAGPYFIKTETDPTGGTAFTIAGTNELMSVPYALFSANGTAGPIGAKGATGAVGPVGATGPVGASGSVGSTGPAGATGSDGSTGSAGASGPAGAAGVAGAQGIQGLTGSAGAAGTQGIQGIQGLTGSVANVAAISGTSTANGASITSGELSLTPADATNGGIVTNGTQTFAGAKTFNATITGSINGNATTATTATTAGTATTATKLAATKNINGVAFDGSADIIITATADAGTLTGTTLKSTVTGSSLTSVGTITSGVWNGTTIAIANGGTGSTTLNFVDLTTDQTINGAKQFQKAATNRTSFNAGTSTAIDFSQSNLAYTSAGGTAPAYTLTNMKDGGAYTLVLTSTTNSGSATFAATGFATINYMGTGALTSGKKHIYSFIAIGTEIYVTMATQN